MNKLTPPRPGALGKALMEALDLRKQLKAQGLSKAELDAAFEQVVRDVWPVEREWHYRCEPCRDTGWKFFVCSEATPCGRRTPERAPERPPTLGPATIGGLPHVTGIGICTRGHDFVRPCRQCEKGQQRHRAVHGPSTPPPQKSAPKRRSRYGEND